MADCSKLTTGLVAANCAKGAIAGTGPAVTLLNYNDIDRAGSTVASNVITQILLEGTNKGHLFESLDDSIEPAPVLAPGKYLRNRWQHDLVMRVFVKTEPAKAFINSLPGARVVAIVENKEIGTAGEVKYEAHGWDAGLICLEAKEVPGYADGVVYEIKLGSSENSKETSLPKSVFKTDIATTETMLAGLVAA